MNITAEILLDHLKTASWPELAAAALAILIATLLFVRVLFGGKGKRSLPRADLALIVGQSGSGKSALFFHWSMPGTKLQTITSQSTNRGKVLSGCCLEIVDFPGHPSLWQGALSLLPRAKKIVYLIDATADKVKLKAVAENLYDLLAAKTLRNDTQLLICRSKTDLKEAKPLESILKTVNDEIELLRTSRSRALEANEIDWLGVDDEKFDLKTQCPIDVSFGSASLKNSDIGDIESFLH